MTDEQAAGFIREYFHALFETRDLDALGDYLHPDYIDDDIGNDRIDNIEAGKSYLTDLFRRHPTVNVSVGKTVVVDDVITSYLEWTTTRSGQAVVHIRGTATFVMDAGRIRRRHTFVYFNDGALTPGT